MTGCRSTGTASGWSTSRRGRWRTTARPTTAPSPAPVPGPPRGRRGRGTAATDVRCGAPRDPAAAGGLPEPVRQVVDHRPVRPLRPGQHRARPAQRQRDDPRRRGDQPRCRGGHRLQRPVRGPRPVRRRTARACRVLPQRLDRRRGADGDQRLPELRLARGPGGDVAVRRGLPRPQGRLRRARDPGDRRQRQPLQPDRRDGDPAHPGRGGARRDRGRDPADADRFRGPRETVSSSSGRPARSSRVRSGRTSCTATSAVAAGRRPARRARTLRASRRGDRAAHLRARPLRRRPRAGAGRVVPAGTAWAPPSRSGATRSSPCSPSPPAGCWSPSPPTARPTCSRSPTPTGCPSPRWDRPEATPSRSEDVFEVPVAEVRAAWTATLPAALA